MAKPANGPEDDGSWTGYSAHDMFQPDSYHKMAKAASDGFGDGTGDLFSYDDVPTVADDFNGDDDFTGSTDG